MHCAFGASPAQLLLGAALLMHAGIHLCASSRLPPRSLVSSSSNLSSADASSEDAQLQWQTYSAELSQQGVQQQAKGTASILMLNSTTAVAMLELQGTRGFDLVSVQIYNASLPPSSPPVVTLLNDTAAAAAAAAGLQYLTFNVNYSMQLNDLLTSGQAGFRVTTQRHGQLQPAGTNGTEGLNETLSGLLKPSTPHTALSPHPPQHSVVSVAASDFSKILDWVQVLLQVAEVLVQVGLPGISSSPLQFISSATATFLDQQDQHERLAGPPLADVGRFQALLRFAQIANQAYDAALTSASNCTAYLGEIYNSTDIVDCSTASGVNQQPYFAYVEHGSNSVIVAIRGSQAILDWSTNADATTTVISPSVGAHKGMFTSARQLLDGLSGKLNTALAANPGYTLSFVGHSLGAGVGALAAYMVKNAVSSGALLSAAAPGVTATCFSTPPVLTMQAAASAEDYITTLLVEDDMVPRLSLGNTDTFIRNVDKQDTQAMPTVQQPDAASQLLIDLNYSSYTVSPSVSPGSEVLYQMYSPGTMLQLISAGGESADDSCLGPMLTGKGPYDRLKTLLLKINMINDHSLVRMIRCLAAHLS